MSLPSVKLNPPKLLAKKDSRTTSCSKILVKNGKVLALSFKIMNSKGKRMNNFKRISEGFQKVRTSYQEAYRSRSNMHCGMSRKPLVPYDPFSYRNRLPVADFNFKDLKKTEFILGDPSLVNRKRWVSTSMDSYRVPHVTNIENTGIIADIAKRNHEKLGIV